MNEYVVHCDIERWDSDPRDGGWIWEKNQRVWADDVSLASLLLNVRYRVHSVLKILEWRAQSIDALRQQAYQCKAEEDRRQKIKDLDNQMARLAADRAKLEAPL